MPIRYDVSSQSDLFYLVFVQVEGQRGYVEPWLGRQISPWIPLPTATYTNIDSLGNYFMYGVGLWIYPSLENMIYDGIF